MQRNHELYARKYTAASGWFMRKLSLFTFAFPGLGIQMFIKYLFSQSQHIIFRQNLNLVRYWIKQTVLCKLHFACYFRNKSYNNQQIPISIIFFNSEEIKLRYLIDLKSNEKSFLIVLCRWMSLNDIYDTKRVL